MVRMIVGGYSARTNPMIPRLHLTITGEGGVLRVGGGSQDPVVSTPSSKKGGGGFDPRVGSVLKLVTTSEATSRTFDVPMKKHD